MLGIPIGRITCQMVWSLLAPSARLPSRKLSGMAFRASSVVRITSGSASRPSVSEPAMMLSPKPKKLTKSDIPNSPNTIDGIPARLLVIMRMNLTTFPFGAYSFMYIPLMMPRGKANSALPTMR